jgi:hypothetical protein
VVKPLAMSGSRGVIRVDNTCEFVQAFARLRTLMAQPTSASSVMPRTTCCWSNRSSRPRVRARRRPDDGALRVFAIFDKPDPLDGPFFEETIYVTPSRESAPFRQRSNRALPPGARRWDCAMVPLHAECRVNAAGVHLLEIAGRPIGGLCSKALRFVSPRGDASLEEVLLRHALQEDVSEFTRERPASGVMMIPIPHRGVYKSVEGENEARAASDIVDVKITAKPDTMLVPLPEGKSYLGFIFARAATALAVEQALRAAHAKLRFRIDREIALI